MAFSRNFKKFLVSECIFKSAFFVRVAGHQGYVSGKAFSEKSLGRLVLLWLSFPFFLITRHEVDTESGQLPPEENRPSVRVGVSVKGRVSFRVGTESGNCSGGQLPPG